MGRCEIRSSLPLLTSGESLAALGFCFFPAEIVDVAEDYYELPEGVWTSKPEGEAVRLVRFFDSTRSYAWCPESRLDLLGESDGALWLAVIYMAHG